MNISIPALLTQILWQLWMKGWSTASDGTEENCFRGATLLTSDMEMLLLLRVLHSRSYHWWLVGMLNTNRLIEDVGAEYCPTRQLSATSRNLAVYVKEGICRFCMRSTTGSQREQWSLLWRRDGSPTEVLYLDKTIEDSHVLLKDSAETLRRPTLTMKKLMQAGSMMKVDPTMLAKRGGVVVYSPPHGYPWT